MLDKIIDGWKIKTELDGSEWTKLTFAGDMYNTITVTNSICFAETGDVASNITIKTVTPSLPKLVLGSVGKSYETLNTSAIEKQLGIGINSTS